jgi:hypothetical protein
LPRSKNKSDSSNKNSIVNKKNYFDDTKSDDNRDIEDEDDSNFEEEDVEYEADVGSLEYNRNNVEANDEIMDDEEEASHLGSGSVRIMANPSIPPLPTTLTRLRPPPVIDLTGNTDVDDDHDHNNDDNDDDAVVNYTPFGDRKKRVVGEKQKKVVSMDNPDHILSQQLAHIPKDQPTVQEWNRIMDNYQEEEYISEKEVEIPKAKDKSTIPDAGTVNHDDKELVQKTSQTVAIKTAS